MIGPLNKATPQLWYKMTADMTSKYFTLTV